MKSPEGFAPTTNKIETEEKEIAPQSPEVEIAEISNEKLEQHAEAVNADIDKQTAEVLPESEQRIESSAHNMNMSAESLTSARQESGIDAQLREIQNEADQIAQEAKAEIAGAVQETPRAEVVEKQQTPEELREERRTKIVKELEKEWEAINGPMERPMTRTEIERLKSWEIINGRKWDGGTTRMTDAASEFFFDHKGMGKNSVPRRAEKILMERFPEYAKQAERQPEQQPEKPKEDSVKIPESQPVRKAPEQAPRVGASSAEKLSGIFEQAGIASKVVKIENGGEFSEAIIFDKKEAPKEKLVRLYRGINHLDASVLEQIPYAMRTQSGTDKPTALEQVRQEVDVLAHNPTYENLMAYADKVRPHLKQEEARRFDEDLARIEDGILDGYSTRRELIQKQIEHGGGLGESGISPYISSSFNPYEAAGYGREGLIIMDVPLSQIEDFRADTTEANIKGALDRKYITAILPRKYEVHKEGEQLNQEIYRALQKVYKEAPSPLYTDEELRAGREQKLADEARLDAEQWKKDVEIIRQKRTARLARRFPEVALETRNVAGPDSDIYTEAKKTIFDFYKARLEKIGRNGRHIEDYEYEERSYNRSKKFDREKTDETMLLKLKILVEHLEEREDERRRR